MAVPSQFRAGDTVEWIEPAALDASLKTVDSTAWSSTAYLRFNKASEGVTITGVARTDGGWDFTISAATTATMDAGQWVGQVVATQGAKRLTLAASTFTVLADLAYSGTPGAFDGRSPASVELAEVQTAIRAIVVRGAQQYSIGSRSYSALNLGALMERESKLKAIVAREQAAERLAAGLGDSRDLLVRFG